MAGLGLSWAEHKTYWLISQNLPTLILLPACLSMLVMMIDHGWCQQTNRNLINWLWNQTVQLKNTRLLPTAAMNGHFILYGKYFSLDDNASMWADASKLDRKQGWKISRQICSVASDCLLSRFADQPHFLPLLGSVVSVSGGSGLGRW